MALDKLDIDYIDMMLLHHPGADDVQAYKAMEQAVADGKIRSIGLSNWYMKELEEFLPKSLKQALVQNEIHPYYQEIMSSHTFKNWTLLYRAGIRWVDVGIQPRCWAMRSFRTLRRHLVYLPLKVILRWNLQKGVVVIPGSSNPDHNMENLDLFDFEQTDDDMERIKELDRNEKHDGY